MNINEKIISIMILALLLASCGQGTSTGCAATPTQANTAAAKKANDDVWRGTTAALKNERIP